MANPDSEKQRYELNRPGWDLHLRCTDTSGCVPSVHVASYIHTLREIKMMGLVNAITDKPEWERKVHDDTIVQRWRQEVLLSPTNQADGCIDSDVFDWCIQEVRKKAEFYDEHKLVPIFDTEFMAAKSDMLVSEGLRKELQAACQRMMNVPHSALDYHPKSNDQVLNIVHPSLYPLMYGKSRVLTPGPVPLANCSTYIGKGETIPHPPPGPANDVAPMEPVYEQTKLKLWSSKYQWLPCEVKFKEDTTAHIDSYVNNLNPEGNEELYSLLANFVDAAIPMWNQCLPLADGNFDKTADGSLRIRVDDDSFQPWDLKPYNLPPATPPRPGAEADAQETTSLIDECDDDRWRRLRRLVHPKPCPFEEWSAPWPSELDLRESCSEEGLQIIFKLSSIELGPGNPTYPGGSWHVEGQYNEHIAATAIYYYDCDNVTESTLSFRALFQGDLLHDLDYPQDDHEGIERTFGVPGRGGDCAQNIGSVVTKQGRMLCFPNNYQHRVSSMELIEKTRPGHRRFVVMWLVDPWNRILSTANVPPQQRDWWVKELVRSESLPLPAEIIQMIGQEVQETFPVSIDEAKEVRLDLMEERSRFEQGSHEQIGQLNLCEH